MACIALAVLTFMLAVVVPMFQSVYERMGGELPVMTLIVIELSKALPYIGTGIGTAVCVAAYIGKVFAKSDQVLSARLPADKLRHPDVEVIGNDRDCHRVLSL